MPPRMRVAAAGVRYRGLTRLNTAGMTLSLDMDIMIRAKATNVAWVAARTEETTASAMTRPAAPPARRSATNTAAFAACADIWFGGATPANATQTNV